MANPEHLAILKQGVEVWNQWRKENPEILPDLCEANLQRVSLYRVDLTAARLQGADLRRADLREAIFRVAHLAAARLEASDLRNANLHKANLCEADLREAKLHGAKLSEAFLDGASLIDTNLQQADLRGANLRLTNLLWANLHGATLSQAILHETIFSNTDLTAVTGLESCIHPGPSNIDLRTLVKSGRLPLQFLRGCGLPDALIDYPPSLLNEAIQLYSVFISYFHRDEEFAQRLHDALQGKDVRCWYAPEDIQGGKKIHEQIDEAIRVYDKLLLALSEHSMQSEWVKTEIANARQREVTENKRVFFPLRLVDFEAIRTWTCPDGDTGKDSAREIREYFIPDFGLDHGVGHPCTF